jgi:hypothetical protein
MVFITEDEVVNPSARVVKKYMRTPPERGAHV